MSLIRNPVARRELRDGTYHLYIDKPMVCFNLFHLIRELERRPAAAAAVRIHLTGNVPLVDHTTCTSLHHFLDEFNGRERGPRLEIEGWDLMRPLSGHDHSTRLAISIAGPSLDGTDRAEEVLNWARATD